MTKEDLNHNVEVIFELLIDSYGFLFRVASKKGHWNEIRCTALAAMCLQLREDGSSRWINEVRAWMQAEQLDEGPVRGSWGEEIWDTAVCIIALKELQVSSRDKSVQNGLKWIADLFSVNGRNNWHDEPWETSWALLAILRAGRILPKVDVGAAIEWLASLQDDSGKIIAPHYTAYFVLINHFSRKVNLSDEIRTVLKLCAQKCQSYLIDALRISEAERLWTGEAWANGQILWCLCLSDRFPVTDNELVGKTIGWFEQNQSSEGNWSDIEDTASATLGLAALLKNLLRHKALKAERPKDVDREFEHRLGRAVPVPKLSIHRHLVERDPETGYTAINFKQSTARLVFAVIGFVGLTLGLMASSAELVRIVRALFGRFH
jgi:hypothetical protein